MNRLSLLLNSSNLHNGGGIQVATSVLSELINSGNERQDLSIAISTEVFNSIGSIDDLYAINDKVEIINVNGLSGINPFKYLFFKKFDRVFTIFGPIYYWNPSFKNIVGFAQPWIIYPDNEVYRLLPKFSQLRMKIKFWIQAQFFKRADVLVVELEHVKKGLVRQLGIDPSRIHVVHNCVSSLYKDENLWEPLLIPVVEQTNIFLKLGFLGRNYVHKNTAIFPDIIDELYNRHGISAKFYVTFTEEEWELCSPKFRQCAINLGPLSPAQCPNFYRHLDAVVFPSLLECFSATPLEALAMGVPLFASDRPFNRDICGDYARYFDPLSAKDAASEIARFATGSSMSHEFLGAARKHAFSFASPQDRLAKYLSILTNA